MISVAAAAVFIASSASTAFAQEGAAAASSVAQLVAQLRTAPTEVDRFRLLEDDQFLFNFNDPNTTVGVTNGAGGHTVAATSENFPAVVGNGVSMTIGFLGPCGMNSPHTHPRATEINFSLNTTLRGGVLVENGARFAEIDIAPGSATVFPQGAIHFEMNPSCETAMFVASFNGEDPGVNQVAQRFFGLPPDIVGAALGGLGVQDVADLEQLIPDNVILGVDECLQRCGIERVAQPTAQRQPRVAANAFPAGTEGTNPFGLAANTTGAEGSSNATAAEGSTNTTAAEGSTTTTAAEGSTNTTAAEGSTNTTAAEGSTNTTAAEGSTESTGETSEPTGESTGETSTGEESTGETSESTGETTTGESTGETTTGESTGETTTSESTGQESTGEEPNGESTGTEESTGSDSTGEATGEESTGSESTGSESDGSTTSGEGFPKGSFPLIPGAPSGKPTGGKNGVIVVVENNYPEVMQFSLRR